MRKTYTTFDEKFPSNTLQKLSRGDELKIPITHTSAYKHKSRAPKSTANTHGGNTSALAAHGVTGGPLSSKNMTRRTHVRAESRRRLLWQRATSRSAPENRRKLADEPPNSARGRQTNQFEEKSTSVQPHEFVRSSRVTE